MTTITLYIDPGTGSMLFSIIIGITGILFFALRALWIKFKFVLSGGRVKDTEGGVLPVAVFSEGKRYWNVYEPVLDEFEKRQKDIWYLTASSDDPALSRDYKHVHAQFIGEGNKAISRMNLIKADIVLSTTPSLDVFQWKRSKGAKWYVHIPHAPVDLNMYRMFGLDYYDAILASGEYQIDQIRRLEKMREMPAKEMVLTGIPYMDSLKAKIEKHAGKDRNNSPVVLLAPSWGSNSILNRYGSEFISKLISTGYKIIIRPHPQSFTSEKSLIDSLMSAFPSTDMLEWNRDTDNFGVLNEADILISDFSGIIYEFSLAFGKPVIYTRPDFDRSVYDCSWDDEEPWTFTTLPKIGRELTPENFGNIAELIESCISGSDSVELSEARKKAISETWCHMGEGAARTADYLISKLEELRKEPDGNKK